MPIASLDTAMRWVVHRSSGQSHLFPGSVSSSKDAVVELHLSDNIISNYTKLEHVPNILPRRARVQACKWTIFPEKS